MEEIHSKSIKANSRSYYFNVKKTKTGDLYLDIAETRKKSDGSFERHNIIIFHEQISQFKKEIDYLYEKFFI